MDIKKILVLLVALVIYTNYENYFKEDISKLYRQRANVKTNIQREIKIQKNNTTKESLILDYDKLIFSAKNYSYSKAMGEMQNQINESAKDICTVKSVKWAQVPTTKLWYDKLRMNVYLLCKPKELFIFTNRLKGKENIYGVENFRVAKAKRGALLNVNFQLIAFRTHK